MDAICSHSRPSRLLSKHIESFQTMSLLTSQLHSEMGMNAAYLRK